LLSVLTPERGEAQILGVRRESSSAGTGNPLTFRDRRAIAVTASGQILMAADMRALHLDTLLQTADSAPARKSQCLRDCGLVADRAQGRANLYRLARPELAALLQAAELLLAGVGHDVQLCGNYGHPCQSDTASEVRP